jgi:hypothetical protein
MQRLRFRVTVRRAARAITSVAMAVLAVSPAALAEDPPVRVRLTDPIASWFVHRSLLGAINRLEHSASCRAVLGDFTTADGKPLSAVLEERGQSPARYVGSLLFLDGTSRPSCRSGWVAAFTAPGWRVVYICSPVFRGQLLLRPADAEALLIHEILHTLGLGENPPTSRAIQERVRARCVTPGREVASTR